MSHEEFNGDPALMKIRENAMRWRARDQQVGPFPGVLRSSMVVYLIGIPTP
jgi:hypothetical protein